MTRDWAQQVKWLRDNDSEFADATVCLTARTPLRLPRHPGFSPGGAARPNIQTDHDAFANSSLSVTTTTAMLARLWAAMAAPANLSNIAADVGVSQEVVTRHVSYLRNAYLLWHCPQKAERTWTPRLRAQDKLYAIDPLIARLAHLRNGAYPDADPTVLTEMQVGMGLHRAAYAAGTPWVDDEFLFHVRTPARKEIDLVGQPLAGAAIEGKYTEGGNWKGEAATVNASGWDGILVTRNVLDCSGPEAWAVPAGLFSYLTDT